MKFLSMISLLVLLAGCTPIHSLHSLSTEETAVYDPALVGMWVSEEDDAVLFVRPEGESPTAYKVRLVEDSSENGQGPLFKVTLVKIADAMWADVTADGMDVNSHSFARLELQGDSLQVRFLESSTWLRERIDADGGPSYVELPKEDGGLIRFRETLLTAKTPEIVALVLRYGGNEEALGDAEVFRRHSTKGR